MRGRKRYRLKKAKAERERDTNYDERGTRDNGQSGTMVNRGCYGNDGKREKERERPTSAVGDQQGDHNRPQIDMRHILE